MDEDILHYADRLVRLFVLHDQIRTVKILFKSFAGVNHVVGCNYLSGNNVAGIILSNLQIFLCFHD